MVQTRIKIRKRYEDVFSHSRSEGKLEAYSMKRVAAGAHLSTRQFRIISFPKRKNSWPKRDSNPGPFGPEFETAPCRFDWLPLTGVFL